MALVTCSECGREISEKAPTCPGCGAPRDEAGALRTMQFVERLGDSGLLRLVGEASALRRKAIALEAARQHKGTFRYLAAECLFGIGGIAGMAAVRYGEATLFLVGTLIAGGGVWLGVTTFRLRKRVVEEQRQVQAQITRIEEEIRQKRAALGLFDLSLGGEKLAPSTP